MKTSLVGLLVSVFCLAVVESPTQAAVAIVREREKPAGDERTGIAVPKPTTGAETGEGAAAQSGDAVQFLNGDRLHGTLASIDPASGVTWQHGDVSQPVIFKPTNLFRVLLRKQKGASANRPPTCSIRLTNGDELLGNLVSLDAEKAILETWYGGRMTVQRSVVQAVTPLQGGLLCIYEGPTGMEGWTIPQNNRGTWKYQNGTLSTVRPGPIGRDFKLPNMVNIEFDLSWRGYLQFMISLYTDSLQDYGGNAYMINLNNNYVYLQRMTRNGSSNQLGQAQVQALARKTRAHMSIRVNKEQRAIALLMDGALIQQWRDPAEFAGKGTGLVFFPQGPAMTRLSNIRITEWDGRFEEPGSSTAKIKEDIIKLANNDKVSGSLKTIQDKKIAFVTSYATLDIPMERVQQIELNGEKSETIKLGVGDVRLYFADRGAVTLSLERWDREQVTGSSPSFGKVKFSPAAFQAIQFNLNQDKRATPIDGSDEEGGGDEGEGGDVVE